MSEPGFPGFPGFPDLQDFPCQGRFFGLKFHQTLLKSYILEFSNKSNKRFAFN